MALTLDGTNGIVSSGSITTQSATGVIFSDSSSLPAASSPYVLKNRIINGDMRIDQRNAGASVTPANGAYTLDRWGVYQFSSASKFSVQQVSGNANTSQGFDQSLRVTSLSAYSVAVGDIYGIYQRIEGFNISDLAWGTASAKTVTLSFWVYSSLTGTFGGAFQNDAGDRAYPFTYTISSANTWEQKTITVAGDTTGTWLKTNGDGLQITFGLGVGSNRSATAGSWQAGNYGSATGATSVVGTNGATWYLTGVQLEVGTTATPFERRMITNELALCQRYFNTSYATGTATGTITNTNQIGRYTDGASNWSGCTYSFPSRMRAIPSVTTWGVLSGATSGQVSGDSVNKTANVEFVSTSGLFAGTYNVASGSGEGVRYQFTASSEL